MEICDGVFPRCSMILYLLVFYGMDDEDDAPCIVTQPWRVIMEQLGSLIVMVLHSSI